MRSPLKAALLSRSTLNSRNKKPNIGHFISCWKWLLHKKNIPLAWIVQTSRRKRRHHAATLYSVRRLLWGTISMFMTTKKGSGSGETAERQAQLLPAWLSVPLSWRPQDPKLWPGNWEHRIVDWLFFFHLSLHGENICCLACLRHPREGVCLPPQFTALAI